jgi:hypothetical protein
MDAKTRHTSIMVCAFCGTPSSSETCAECNQPNVDVEWTAEPRAWSLLRTIGEGSCVVLATSLFALPITHGVAAAFVLMGQYKTADGIIARLFVGGMALLMAAVEVSLIRGLVERVLARWARKWTFRTTGGSGWVRAAPSFPEPRVLAGFGQIQAENGTHYKWMADYRKGVRNTSRVPLRYA